MLKDALDQWYTVSDHPPEPSDLGENVRKVSTKSGDTLRWGTVVTTVYSDGNEYWAVKDVEPATEMQEWGAYGSPEIFRVEPIEVTVTKYIKA